MIKLIVKQIWNQREKNVWIILELFIVFIVLWYVVDFFSFIEINVISSAGTSIQNIHCVKLSIYKEDAPNLLPMKMVAKNPEEIYFVSLNVSGLIRILYQQH